MRIVLLDIEGHGPTFIAEDRDRHVIAPEDSAKPGIKAWFERKGHKLADDLEKTSGVLKKFWSAMQRFVAPDEQLLRNLRKAESLTIEHPSRCSANMVQDAWRDYLARKVRKHCFWMAVDGVLSVPAIVLLTPLPGPNVVGYWVFYRAIVHAFAFIGARNARKGKPVALFCANECLDACLAPEDHERIKAIEEGLNLPGLSLLIARYVVLPKSE